MSLLAILFVVTVTKVLYVSHAGSPGESTLATLQNTTLPTRNPVDLAVRLLGLKTIPTPIPPAQAHSYQVGETRTFKAVNNESGKVRDLTATLWYKTDHVYMFFEGDFQPNMDKVEQAADTFEKSIYPTDHSYFGTESSPGLDGDVHLYILHARQLGEGILGYFDPTSEFSKLAEPNSNECEIFLINLDYVADKIGSTEYLSTLAHEFQHMIHSNVDPNESGWVDEGMSVTAEMLNGYTADTLGFAQSFMKNPRTQLNAWAEANTAPHYGGAFLFFSYFLGRFGEDALRALVANPKNDLEGVADTLKEINAVDPATKKPVTVEDLFADWTIANLLNDPNVGDGRYVYTQLSKFRLPLAQTTDRIVLTDPQQTSTRQWGTSYLELSTPGQYTFSFKGQSTVRVIPTQAHGGNMFWWSNRADRSDTRMTHSFDLTSVKTATLNFSAWYATEPNYDYAYVEVSTDNGTTWTPLKSQDSVDKSDNNPYGPAFNGFSGVQLPADAKPNAIENAPQSAQWRQEQIDLTPYAGKKIQIRFESLTDAALNFQGVAVDDISIPEIKYSTNAETDDGGWTPEGWVRMDNTLPQSYVVQLVELGKTTRVTRLLSPRDGVEGQWKINVGGDVTRVIIVVSGLSEFTTEPAPFQYTVTPQ